MDVIQESSSLDSESGKSISKIERDKIHKAIMLLEDKIKKLKVICKISFNINNFQLTLVFNVKNHITKF